MQSDIPAENINVEILVSRIDNLTILVKKLCNTIESQQESPRPEGVFNFPTENSRDNERFAVRHPQTNNRTTRPALPDPRLLRRIIRQRQLRTRYFDGELFGDPAWDMLLDLAAARVEYERVSVTSLCIASGVPPTTALRWISEMTKIGLLVRVEDETDRRRAFISLSEKASDALARYFAALGPSATDLV